MGFREFTMRGEDITRAQWLFACSVHNVMKAMRYISGQRRKRQPSQSAVKGDSPLFRGPNLAYIRFLTPRGGFHTNNSGTGDPSS